MNNHSANITDIRDQIDEIKTYIDAAEDAIEQAENVDSLTFLIEENKLDTQFEGDEREKIRETILTSSDISYSLKKIVGFRGRDIPEKILVPDSVQANANTALEAGKPVVLYGPTGTGKTTFARQLSREYGIGYDIHTATPSWTDKNITGGIQPEFQGGQLRYRNRPGSVADAVLKCREYDEPYTLILDEITRADISRIFGPLYTAIEDPQQVIFETDDGTSVELDSDLNIICTMNMSDRTVNELDDAITRRFAMIQLDEYDLEDRQELFEAWATDFVSGTRIDADNLVSLFEADYTGLNGESITAEDRIMQFGPMHYRDVAKFLEQGCKEGGAFEENPYNAVGHAFETYIIPRLLNSANLSQVDEVLQHYEELNSQFSKYDLTPALTVIRKHRAKQRRQIGGYE
jgi:5-methylcytosine-specific restriction protein B